MDDRPDPTKHNWVGPERWARLKAQLDCYKRQDPPTLPQLAVPVTLTEHLLDEAFASPARTPTKLKQQATADLCNIAFYFLLRVGEYTKPRAVNQNTVLFAVHNVTFRDSNGHEIPNSSPLEQLYQAVDATVRIPNQKNGTKGQNVHVECTKAVHSPIKSLARRVHHIMSTGHNDQSVPIYSHSNPLHVAWQPITADHINATLKKGAETHGLYTLFGYERSDISSHSLRAGGAMALHINGCTDLTIQKLGRWKGKSFEMYVHEQITAFSAGLSLKMSTHVPFRAIATPRVDPPRLTDEPTR